MTKQFILCVLAIVVAIPAWSDDIQGKVIGVADGDTITVLDVENIQHKIRLSGIDAPEKKQPYGNLSKQHLADMVFGRIVDVEYRKHDRYGRIVGKVLLDGRDMNIEQVKAGLAWHYKQYAKEQAPNDRKLYADVEEGARNSHIGLWRDVSPIAPWEWRREATTLIRVRRY